MVLYACIQQEPPGSLANMEQQTLNQIAAEQQQLDVLLDKGMFFDVEKRSLLRFIGKKERRFVIKQPYLGTLDALSNEFIKMEYSEDELKKDPFGESKRIVEHNALRCGRVIAIALLNSQWGIKLFTRILANYFVWHLNPQKLLDLTMMINTMANIPAFINSIRYLSVEKRTTKPILIEETSPKIDPKANEFLNQVRPD